MGWHYLWWFPVIITYYAIFSWMSKKSSDTQATSWAWGLWIYGGLCPWWVITARMSKNLLFDGMLYDNLMFLTYAVTLLALGAGSKFSIHQWVGLGLIVIGSVFMRIEV